MRCYQSNMLWPLPSPLNILLLPEASPIVLISTVSPSGPSRPLRESRGALLTSPLLRLLPPLRFIYHHLLPRHIRPAVKPTGGRNQHIRHHQPVLPPWEERQRETNRSTWDSKSAKVPVVLVRHYFGRGLEGAGRGGGRWRRRGRAWGGEGVGEGMKEGEGASLPELSITWEA